MTELEVASVRHPDRAKLDEENSASATARLDRYLRLAQTARGTEAGDYLRRFWHPILLADEVPSGYAAQVRIMGEDLAIWRTTSGQVSLVANQCPHRGTFLHTGTVEGDFLRCMYHGWMFAGDGQCVAAPPERETFAARQRVASYPVEEYLGLVFAYLGEGTPPPLPRYPELEEGAAVRAQSYDRRCNYFYDVDNGLDPTHTYFTHAGSSLDVAGLDAVPEVEGEESRWGIAQYGRRGGRTRVSHHGMPNILLLSVPDFIDEGWPWSQIMVWRVPVDDDSHINFTVNFLHGTAAQNELYLSRMVAWEQEVAALPPRHDLVDDILAGRVRVRDPEVLARADLLMIQDDVTQVAQGPLERRAEEKLGRGDVLITLLRRLWRRDLDAIANGEEPTAWEWTPEHQATNGLA
ncbi:Rieske 2Fe-2S domain-containing protein [Pimelobacter simplex]|uniref:Rieske 2Fe-2S domain-containing protein n=1 Tax=Nocardioides simplex TaxID=2045 RepID=UPI003AB0849C